MAGKRNEAIDILRGFSLLCIFFVNMPAFQSPSLYINATEWWKTPIDRLLNALTDVMLQASIYPLFSFLFGFGLAAVYKKSKFENLNFRWIAIRRLGFLLLVGIAHVLFVWHGDILISYVWVGTLAALLLEMPPKILVRAGIVLYFLPNTLIACALFLFKGNSNEMYNAAEAGHSLQVYASGSFHEILVQRIHDWEIANNPLSILLMFTIILPSMLIGMAWAKTMNSRQRRFEKRHVISLFIAGFSLKCAPYLFGWSFLSHFVQDVVGGPLLGASYALAIFFSKNNSICKSFLRIFSPAGRMSLSNYLFQSLAATFIFYHYGLGFYGHLSLVAGELLAVVLFCGQLLFSAYWLKRHTYGPIEWVWRGITFMRFPKWRK